MPASSKNGKQLPGGGSELRAAKGAPPATLALTRRNGKAHLQFSVSRVGVLTPQACQQLPVSVSENTPSFTVNTSLRITNGHRAQTINMPATWRCVRNKAGTITKITTVKPTAPAHRPGLASPSTPRTVSTPDRRSATACACTTPAQDMAGAPPARCGTWRRRSMSTPPAGRDAPPRSDARSRPDRWCDGCASYDTGGPER